MEQDEIEWEEMEEILIWRAKTRCNRIGWNVNQWKRGDMVGVNGFEQDKPARNEAGWLGTGKDKPGKTGKRRDWML